MEFVNANRRTFQADVTVTGPSAEVFPLLCPVREYDWIPDWAGEIVYSGSGIAELGCVFRTRRGTGDEVWTVSRYQPDEAIGFVRVVAGGWVVLMDLDLSPLAAGETALRVRNTFTALSPAGADEIDAMDERRHQDHWQSLAAMAGHYLRTGTMLTPPAEPAGNPPTTATESHPPATATG